MKWREHLLWIWIGVVILAILVTSVTGYTP
jgi:hypothetical protein